MTMSTPPIDSGASALPLPTAAPTVNTRKNVPIDSTTHLALKRGPLTSSADALVVVALVGSAGLTIPSFSLTPVAHVVGANAHLRHLPAPLRAYLLAAIGRMVLPTASGSQVVAHHGRSQAVEVGHHDASLDGPRDLCTEARQAWMAAKPEDRHLSTEPGHIVEPTHGVGDGPRMRRVVKKHRRALAVKILQVSGRLTIGDHQHDG